jgi:hypothetical protein
MRTRDMREWKHLYQTVWRALFAHLPKAERAKLVRGCRGKAIYDSRDEAEQVIDRLTLRPGKLLGAYDCPLCGDIHTGNRKYLRWDLAVHYARIRRCNETRTLEKSGTKVAQ